jgi:hypothetical protein
MRLENLPKLIEFNNLTSIQFKTQEKISTALTLLSLGYRLARIVFALDVRLAIFIKVE